MSVGLDLPELNYHPKWPPKSADCFELLLLIEIIRSCRRKKRGAISEGFQVAASVGPAMHQHVDNAYAVFERFVTLRICLISAVVCEVQGDARFFEGGYS